MVTIIWSFFIICGIIFCILNGKLELLNSLILNSSKESLELIIQIFPVMALWLGIMNIAKVSGLLDKIANLISPLLTFLFPEIPKGHKSLSYIASNVAVNLFGLGNAATPFGLKAMESLQELNDNKEVASRSMITFLVLNTSGMTLIPTTIISLRMFYNSHNPTSIVLPCIIATTLSTIGGLSIDRLLARRKNR